MATAIHQGRKEIAATGTRVAIGSALEVNWMIVVAELHNKGPIVVGSVSVTRDESATDGPRLEPGKPLPAFGKCDIGDVYINGLKGDSAFYIAASGT